MQKGLYDDYEELINQYLVLSAEEEKELFLTLKNTGSIEIRKKIINSNIRLVIKLCLNYIKQCDNSFTFNDMVEYGIIGLIKAVDNFDVSKNFKFSTYATNWIRREILCSLDLRFCDINKPYKFFSDRKLYFNTIKDFHDSYGRKPSVDEISSLTGLSSRRIRFIESNFDSPVSLDDFLFGDSNYCISDTIYDCSLSAEEKFDIIELRSIYMHILDSMDISNRKKEMFIMRYGLDGNEKRTLEYLATRYGITYQAVKKSTDNILKKMRTKYSHYFEGYI